MPRTPNYSFLEAFKAVRVIEASENYSVADDLQSGEVKAGTHHTFSSEGSFWHSVLAHPNESDSKPHAQINLTAFTLSAWIPRIPGLYWNEQASAIRIAVSQRNKGRLIYDPNQKSRVVLGGIGTNCFPPASDGSRLVGLCSAHNASSGVPAIISKSVWHKLSLQPGQLVNVSRARWQGMSTEWYQRFETIKGIPRSYLVIEDESQLSVEGLESAPSFQPFTIMEYADDNALFYDYVFCTARSIDSRQQISDFFETYRTTYGANGRYLLASDPANPLFDADYSTPEQLRQAEPGGRSQLDMLKERVKDNYFKGWQLDQLLKIINRHYTVPDEVRRVATYLSSFPVAQLSDRNAATMLTQIMDWCVRNQKVEEFIDILVVDNPHIMISDYFN